MAKICNSISELVGNTPLLRMSRFAEAAGVRADILGKLEYLNPTGSTKDRIALAMIEAAEAEGRLKKGDVFAETTSGNTGISLAALAAVKGYGFRPFIQDFVSEERKQVIRAFGAQLVNMSEVPEAQKALEESGGDFVAATAAVKQKMADEGVFVMDQMHNPKNPAAHYETTGREIWDDTGGRVDVLVAAVGTGGTISGTGNYLKKKNPAVRVIAVEPRADERDITGVHRFSDVDEKHFPANLDTSVYDEVLTVSVREAYAAARLAARTEGILIGASSGAALHAASLVAGRSEFAGKIIAVILPDTGLRYLSARMFEPETGDGQEKK